MKKLIFSVLVLVLMMSLFLATPVMAYESTITMSSTNVVITQGGTVGEETTITATVTIISEAIPDKTPRRDMAVCNVGARYYLLDSEWYLVDTGKQETHKSSYEWPLGTGAHAYIEWTYEFEYTWIPDVSGIYYLSFTAWGINSLTDGSGSWPPVWITDWEQQYFYYSFEIMDPVPVLPQSTTWYNDGSFEIAFGEDFAYHEGFNWSGIAITEAVNMTAQFGSDTINIIIPSNTVVLGTDRIMFDYADGNINIIEPQQAVFSQPVTIKVNGVSVLTFSQIYDYVPY